jgi:hypothetical protein
MKLRILQGKISGECFVVDTDTFECCGPISQRELTDEPDLTMYNLDGNLEPSDMAGVEMPGAKAASWN